MAKQPDAKFPIARTNDEWRAELSKEQYHVLREHGTEPAGASALNGERREGEFCCAGCGAPLFDSATKFDSGSGWPSFTEPRPGMVGESVDKSHYMLRTEVQCLNCGGHLGHVFPDGPQPQGTRYCLNGAALKFTARPENS